MLLQVPFYYFGFMKRKVLITGASGMVGKGVLLECLDHPEITEVLTIGRSPCGISHPKLKEIRHQDFSDFSSVQNELQDLDACYFCMGVSANGLNEAEYHLITHEYTLALARILRQNNEGLTFIYVSGEGTDSSEKGRMMWARVKGKTENDLLALGFKQAFMFRPGIIIPLRGIKSKTRLYQFFYDYFNWLFKAIKKLAPRSMNNTTEIGLAMINATLQGSDKNILRPSDIQKLAQ